MSSDEELASYDSLSETLTHTKTSSSAINQNKRYGQNFYYTETVSVDR